MLNYQRVNWDDSSQYMGNQSKCSKPPTSKYYSWPFTIWRSLQVESPCFPDHSMVNINGWRADSYPELQNLHQSPRTCVWIYWIYCSPKRFQKNPHRFQFPQGFPHGFPLSSTDKPHLHPFQQLQRYLWRRRRDLQLRRDEARLAAPTGGAEAEPRCVSGGFQIIEMRCKRHLSYIYIYHVYIIWLYVCIYTYIHICIYIYIYNVHIWFWMGFWATWLLVYLSDIVRGHTMFGGLKLF